MAGHLGVKTPGDPSTPEPSTTNNCWPSRAPKKSALNVRVDGVRKMQQNAAKSPPQTVMTLSMKGI